MKHKHHIIPKHMGGSDTPENIIELTPEQHAEAHKELWEKYNKWQDYIAWQGLSKRITKEQIHRECARAANLGKKSPLKGRKLKPRSEVTKQKIRETCIRKGIRPPKPTAETREKATNTHRNRVWSAEERQRKSDGMKKYIADNPGARSYPRSKSRTRSISLSKPLFFKGKYYSSLKACKEENKTTAYHIKKDLSFKYV